MGLKNVGIFANRPVSFTGLNNTHRIVDEQHNGECWIEALENLAQLYLPTKYPTVASARQAVLQSIKNPESIESAIRYALVKDLVENSGKTFGYKIEFLNSSGHSVKTICAANITTQELQVFAHHANNTRAYFQSINPTFIVDDNIGAFTYQINIGRPLTEVESYVLPGTIAYCRIIDNLLGIEVSTYRFDERIIRAALDADRPVFFRMNVIGFNRYGGQRGGHAILIADYVQRGNETFYMIIDSNEKEYCYTVTSKELCNAARAHGSFETEFQLIIPDKSTPWNNVMV